jgi:hypothetical protein
MTRARSGTVSGDAAAHDQVQMPVQPTSQPASESPGLTHVADESKDRFVEGARSESTNALAPTPREQEFDGAKTLGKESAAKMYDAASALPPATQAATQPTDVEQVAELRRDELNLTQAAPAPQPGAMPAESRRLEDVERGRAPAQPPGQAQERLRAPTQTGVPATEAQVQVQSEAASPGAPVPALGAVQGGFGLSETTQPVLLAADLVDVVILVCSGPRAATGSAALPTTADTTLGQDFTGSNAPEGPNVAVEQQPVPLRPAVPPAAQPADATTEPATTEPSVGP